MRILHFVDSAIYEILYDGLLNTTKPLEAPSETRVIGRILDKLEQIGKPAERGGVATFTLGSPDFIELEDVEYRLMEECLKSVRWTARAARVVTKAMEFFNDASREVRARDGDLPAHTGSTDRP